MTLSTGTRLGPYEIVAPRGAGGMGEVYRGRDTRLDRCVAIKVLPASLAEAPDRRARFEREARAISALNHPHICTLHDLGQDGGVNYLVMEYLEGETLAERLARGPLPLEQVLRCGVEIASALAVAHRAGIVHRDLKPGNIMLTKSGVKLLDFGLAKLRADREVGVLSTRLDQALTGEGTLLGTLPYMAPEQLEGREADARSDIWALGTVVYEMATGRRAFAGESQASLIGAILKDEPAPITDLQPVAPAALERVVKACLQKDPDERWQSAQDVATAVRWAAAPYENVPPATARGTKRLAWLAWGVVALLAAALGYLALRPARPVGSADALVTSLLPPDGWSFQFGPFALSPDGRQIVFAARKPGSESTLWVRALDGSFERMIAGTSGASSPFWSPDSRSLGFFAERKLRRILLPGGAPETLCDAREAVGGSWNQENVIVFAPGAGQPIHAVPAAGGACRPVTRVDTERREAFHAAPVFLPDGQRFIFGVATGDSAPFLESIHLGSLDGREPKRLIAAAAAARYASGHLLFWRDQVLRAQRFDPEREELAGEAVQIAADVIAKPVVAAAAFSASQTGLLAYATGAATADRSQMQWFDRSGVQLGSLGEPDFYYFPRLSHDGRRVAVDKSNPQQQGDIWEYDVQGPGSSRLTSGIEDESRPIWSPEDDCIIYFNLKPGRSADLYRKCTDRVAGAEPVFVSPARKIPTDWSIDGNLVVFNSFESDENGWDLWILSLADRKASPFLATRFDERDGAFSSDGRWLAYVSDESGRDEVYVQAFPGPGPRRMISTGGGIMPRWRRDGAELFYAARDGRLMAVPIRATSTVEAGTPIALFQTRMKMDPASPQFDVSPDGRRFLLNSMLPETDRPLTLVVNWPTLLKR